jgi:hypothetical protein
MDMAISGAIDSGLNPQINIPVFEGVMAKWDK